MFLTLHSGVTVIRGFLWFPGQSVLSISELQIHWKSISRSKMWATGEDTLSTSGFLMYKHTHAQTRMYIQIYMHTEIHYTHHHHLCFFCSKTDWILVLNPLFSICLPVSVYLCSMAVDASLRTVIKPQSKQHSYPCLWGGNVYICFTVTHMKRRKDHFYYIPCNLLPHHDAAPLLLQTCESLVHITAFHGRLPYSITTYIEMHHDQRAEIWNNKLLFGF